MNQPDPIAEDAQAIAEGQAAKDAELLAKLQAAKAEAQPTLEQSVASVSPDDLLAQLAAQAEFARKMYPLHNRACRRKIERGFWLNAAGRLTSSANGKRAVFEPSDPRHLEPQFCSCGGPQSAYLRAVQAAVENKARAAQVEAAMNAERGDPNFDEAGNAMAGQD
jgi:hypothetical protein